MSVRIAESKLMHRILKVVILKKAGKDMMKLLLIWKLVAYRNLRLMQLR